MKRFPPPGTTAAHGYWCQRCSNRLAYVREPMDVQEGGVVHCALCRRVLSRRSPRVSAPVMSAAQNGR